MEQNNLSSENLSRRDFLTATALTGLSLVGLRGLEGEVTQIRPKQKTPKDYGIEMNEHYGVGLFLCNKILEDQKLNGLESFVGINKGIKSDKVEGVRREPVYKKDEELYLVIYNPERKNHRLGFNVLRVIEESGIKFIDDKPYRVKIERGKIVEKKLETDEPPKEGDIFYEIYQRKLDILYAIEFEEVARKGPFELKGAHRAFSAKKLKPGRYNILLETYNGSEPNGCLSPTLYFKIE